MSVLVDQRIKNAGRKNSPVSHSALGKDNSLDGRLSFGISKLTTFKNLKALEEAWEKYINFYNNQRVKAKLIRPIEYRKLVLS